MTVKTPYFSSSPREYVSVAMSSWVARWWWLLALPAVTLLGLGCRDIRFLIVALALALVAYPGILALVYFNYALHPLAAFATIPHSLTVSADGIYVTYRPDEGRHTPPDRMFAATQIASVADEGSRIVVTLTTGRYDMVIIPAEHVGRGEMARIIQICNLWH